jgi:hypothetical protein
MPYEAQKSRDLPPQHMGYALSIKHCKRFEEAFFSAMMGYRRVARVCFRFILMMSANNLALLPRLLAI